MATKRRKKSTIRIEILFVISAILLAGIGVAYSQFTDTLTINGTVNTGSIDLVVTEYSGTWAWKVYGPIAPAGEIYIDHSGGTSWQAAYPGCTFQLIGYSAAAQTPGQDDDHVTITYNNLFPCIDFMADVEITYQGTIPAMIDVLTIDWQGDKITLPDDTVVDLLEWLYDEGELIYSFFIWNDATQKYDIPVETCYQLEQGDEIRLVITIHIPQEIEYEGEMLVTDFLMNVGGTGEITLGVIQWNEANCEKTFALPTNMLQMYFQQPGWEALYDSNFDVWFNGIPGAPGTYNVVNGIKYDGFCVNQYIMITPPGPHSVYLYSTLDYDQPGFPDQGQHWPTYQWDYPCVNYVLNHREEYPIQDGDYLTLQWVIWYFVDNCPYEGLPSQLCKDIVDDAKANVEEWYADFPKVGDRVAVYVQTIDNPSNPKQDMLIDVDP